MASTFTINRIEFKKMLSAFRVSDKNIDNLLNSLEKMHRHVNVIIFVTMLQKLGLEQKQINNIFRRVGIDDVSITNIFEVVDEEKIRSTFGRVVDLVVD